jgi:hypothetical protein
MFTKSPFEKDPRYLEALKWLWAHNKMDIAFLESVVTDANREKDKSTIDPPLNNSEAINFFAFLERKELLHKVENGGWILNKVERNKWVDLVEDLKRPDWTRSWLAKSTYSLLLFIGSGLLGAFIAIRSEGLFSQDGSKEYIYVVREELGSTKDKGDAQESYKIYKSDSKILQDSNLKTVPAPTQESNEIQP